MSSRYILGIHYGHDATAVLMVDGNLVEAMSEERLSREKKHIGFPRLAVDYIKSKYNIKNFNEVFVVGEVFNEWIFLNKEDNNRIKNKEKEGAFFRAVGFHYKFLGKFFKIFDIIRFSKNIINAKQKTEDFLKKEFPDAKISFIHHHLAHAWASIPFMEEKEKKLIFTLDGQGDDMSGSINLFDGKDITLLHSIKRENSLGSLYSSVVDILGMTRNEHEFKVMGLAPYAKKSSGEKVLNKLKDIIWFDKNKMTLVSKIDTRVATEYFIANDFYMYRFDSIAYGIQKLTENIVLDMIEESIKKYNIRDIALAGGVFMNVKANQVILESELVKSVTITPSCGDESLAIGACVYGFVKGGGDLKDVKELKNIYLGSSYEDEQIKKELDSYKFKNKISIKHFNRDKGESIEKEVAKILSNNGVVGRFFGRSEWGARALGNRSILANPSSRDNVKLINEMIKGRDFWMPFATSILYEKANEYLDIKKDFYAPFMAITFDTKNNAEEKLIAALHPYDLTSRPQMVKREVNQNYYDLINEFYEITGCPGILNTSFNLHGEPNVETPYDAIRTFDLSGLPHLSIGNYLVSKI